MNFTLFIIICGGLGIVLGTIVEILPAHASRQFMDALSFVFGVGTAIFIAATLIGGIFAVIMHFSGSYSRRK